MSRAGTAEAGVPRRSAMRTAAQLVGFALGVALLSWCASVAFAPRNREQLARLADAPWTDGVLLVALSLLSLLINSAIFWAVLRPVRAVPFSSILPVNLVATALGYLPFKLSLLFRAAAHTTRDRVPLLLIGTWMGNVGVILLAVIGPALVAVAWRPRIDAGWWLAAAGGAGAVCALIVIVARAFSHDRLWHALEQRLVGADPQPRGWRGLVSRFGLVPRIHEGVRMLAHPTAVFGGAALRAADIGVQSARFIVAARILKIGLPPDQAIAAASAFFLIGVLSPAGVLGFREAGVLSILRSDHFALVVLTVTAVEMVATLACAIPAAIYLRLTRAPSATRMPNTDRSDG